MIASNFPKSSIIIIVAVIAIIIANVYQKVPFNLSQFNISGNITPGSLVQQKTQTILKEENVIIDVVDKVSPSVVAIGATRKIFNPFDPFTSPRNQSSTIGTGFVVSVKGIIVTNKHVVSDVTATYNIITKNGKKYSTKKIYRDPILDLAIVSIEEDTNLVALDLGNSSDLKVGQTVIAIGNALGKFTNTVTTGIVSGLGRQVDAGDPFSGVSESLDNLIQTDAAINPGNSGGPLLNSAGQVIGVNVATTEGAQNIGFAIPINSVKKIVSEFVQTGKVSRPYLGIRYQFISKDVAIMNEIPQGAYIQDVLENSPAEKAGIKVGDIITKINNEQITDATKITSVIASKKIGDSLNLTVWNDNKERSVTAFLQDMPSE